MAKAHAPKKQAPQKKPRKRASVFTTLLLLALLVGLGVTLHRQQAAVVRAQSEKAALEAQVQSQQQENAALAEDIAEGPTQEKMEEIAREQLGYVEQGERVFYDVSN